jgi:uncharacterized protein YndB with AHSA1/START domain
MENARTLSVFIDRPWREVYESIWRPPFFARWAAGLSDASLRQQGDRWLANGPDGAATIQFAEYNEFGIMDHRVVLADGQEIHVPLRVVQHGAGAEVMLTLFRLPGMSDEKFEADAALISADLAALQSLVSPPAAPDA